MFITIQPNPRRGTINYWIMFWATRKTQRWQNVYTSTNDYWFFSGTKRGYGIRVRPMHYSMPTRAVVLRVLYGALYVLDGFTSAWFTTDGENVFEDWSLYKSPQWSYQVRPPCTRAVIWNSCRLGKEYTDIWFSYAQMARILHINV